MKRIIVAIAVCIIGLSAMGIAAPIQAASGSGFNGFNLDCGGATVSPSGPISYVTGDDIKLWMVDQESGNTIGQSNYKWTDGNSTSSQSWYVGLSSRPKANNSVEIFIEVQGVGRSSAVRTYAAQCYDDGRTFKDGRVDAYNAGQTVAVYCKANTIEVWRIINQQGVKVLDVPKSGAGAAPSAPAAPSSSFGLEYGSSLGALASQNGGFSLGGAADVGGSGFSGAAGVNGGSVGASSQGVSLTQIGDGVYRVTGPSLDPSKPNEIYTYDFTCK